MVKLNKRFDEALVYAERLHRGATRKETSIPYVAHLLSVAGLILSAGGSQREAIAALLHDAAEDAGGERRLAKIREKFGKSVAEIVRSCSDTMEDPKPEWRPRKEAYIQHLGEASPFALLVSLADKVDNARAIAMDLEQVGSGVWNRFNAPREDSLWYYRAVLERFREELNGEHHCLLRELELNVLRLEAF